MSSEKKTKSIAVIKRTVKTVAVLLMFAVILFVLFRVFSADYYPRAMKELLVTDPLASYYEKSGLPTLYSQELRVNYDNSKEGNFFADHLLFSHDAGAVQVTVRYNESTLERLLEAGKLSSAEDPFRYRIFACTGGEKDAFLGASYTEYERLSDEFFVYRYDRVAFDGVSLEGVVWVRLDVLSRESGEVLGSIVILENNEDYAKTEAYSVSEKLFQ